MSWSLEYYIKGKFHFFFSSSSLLPFSLIWERRNITHFCSFISISMNKIFYYLQSQTQFIRYLQFFLSFFVSFHLMRFDYFLFFFHYLPKVSAVRYHIIPHTLIMKSKDDEDENLLRKSQFMRKIKLRDKIIIVIRSIYVDWILIARIWIKRNNNNNW